MYCAKLTLEGERWLAEFPDCPGCQTFGDTQEHALLQAKDALEGWLISMLELRRPLPVPTFDGGVLVYVDVVLRRHIHTARG